MHSAVVNAEQVSDRSLSHVMHFTVVNHIQSVTVADALVNLLGCKALNLSRGF